MTKVNLNTIDLNAPTQLREMKESQRHIEDLAFAYVDKGEFSELPWVGRISGEDVLVPIDGFHRLHAIDWLASEEFEALTDKPDIAHLNLDKVDVRITTFATMAEAIIAAAGVNSTHGLKRKNGDIKNAIAAILEVEPMRFMVNPYKLNPEAIMTAVNCSKRTYARETSELRSRLEAHRDLTILELHDEGKSQRDIAGIVGVGQMTVSRVLESESNEPMAKMVQDESQGEENAPMAQIPQDESPEEEQGVLSHITSVTPIANPWGGAVATQADIEKSPVAVPSSPQQEKPSVGTLLEMFEQLTQEQKEESVLIMTDLLTDS